MPSSFYELYMYKCTIETETIRSIAIVHQQRCTKNIPNFKLSFTEIKQYGGEASNSNFCM